MRQTKPVWRALAPVSQDKKYRGVAVRRDSDGKRIIERCLHRHLTKDGARTCASSMAMRRNVEAQVNSEGESP